MTEKFDTHGMYRELTMLGNEVEYEAFLRRQSLAGGHSFLLAAISRSNLNHAIRRVLKEVITGKLRRPKYRPPRNVNETHMIGLRRALCVLDLEAEGWDKREAAIEEARQKLREPGRKPPSFSVIEKAVYKYEEVIKAFDPAI